MKSKPFFLSFACILLLIFTASSAFAADYDLIVVNSDDWVDVYNSLLFGALTNTKTLFLSDQSQTNILFNSISGSVDSILLVESDSRLSPTASRILTSLGYEVEVLSNEDTSLFFAEKVSADSYILVDKNFPSNGLSVAPYAVASNSWVFFVDATVSEDVLSIIGDSEVVTYGRVPLNLLQQTTPSAVIDKGNKYKNSVAMAKFFLDKFPTGQYVLTQGSFLETEFFIPSYPVLIVGVSTTPKPIEDFFVESNVVSAVVVGQTSIPSSMNLKRFLESTHNKEIKLVAKLGQTSADPTAANEILPLNLFPLPSPKISITLDSFFYNQITSQIEARFSNVGDVFLSYVPSVELTINGEKTLLQAPLDHYDLEKSESRTVQFPVELNNFDDISATVTVTYGESSDSFDLSSSYDFDPLEFISIVDNSNVLVKNIVYDEKNKVFLIEVFNNGSVSSYADITLSDVIVGGVPESFSSPRAIAIAPQTSAILVIYALLSPVDILANPQVTYDVEFGQRNFALIKHIQGTLPLGSPSTFDVLLESPGVMVAILAVLVFAVLLFFLLRKKKRKSQD